MKVLYSVALLGLVALGLSKTTMAQISYGEVDGRTNAINTAVPFLRISPDARSASMGDVGIALSPDANAVFWNLSKLAFAKEPIGVSITYTPWLRQMANDVFLGDISAYKQLDNTQAIGASLRYFDMGSIRLTNFEGESLGNAHPREFSFDVGYTHRLSDYWSAGVAFRYIYSNLASGVKANGTSYKAGNAIAGDFSVSYFKDVDYSGDATGTWSFGATLTNLGTKISYTTEKDNKYFLPSNLGVGGAYTYHLDNDKHRLTVAVDINKLLVPTPDSVDGNNNGIYDYQEKSVVGGIFSSLGDAPGGFKEEFHELMYSAGVEYWYESLFALRAGYFNEYKTKGDRKYVTVGVGLRYNSLGMDFSYLIPSGSGVQRNPLSNTVRLSLSVVLGGDKSASSK